MDEIREVDIIEVPIVDVLVDDGALLAHVNARAG
jgi:hypothetical protein